MTCYQRHLGWLFDALELPYDTANRKAVDAALKEVLDVSETAHCPEVWAAVKALPEGEFEAMVPQVGALVAAGRKPAGS